LVELGKAPSTTFLRRHLKRMELRREIHKGRDADVGLRSLDEPGRTRRRLPGALC
jgi:TnpA family transposase